MFALPSSRLVPEDVQGGTVRKIVHPAMLCLESTREAYDMLYKAAEHVVQQQ